MASNTNNQKAPHDIHTGYPGFVYNFNPVDQTCEVQLAIESLFVGTQDAYSVETKQRLQKVPVQFVQGGGFCSTHPVPDGSPCYVHFAERGIQHWLAEGKDKAGISNGKPAPAFSQLFSHNAAVCFIGLNPLTSSIKSFQTDAFEIRNADRSVRASVSNSSVTLFAGSAVIKINKDGEVSIESASKIIAKAPQIILDGDATVTKSLTVQGGMAVTGGTAGSNFSITGDIKVTGGINQAGTFTLNGIKVDNHTHTNPEGGNVGTMKAS